MWHPQEANSKWHRVTLEMENLKSCTPIPHSTIEETGQEHMLIPEDACPQSSNTNS